MKKDNIDKLFERLQDEFDFEEPQIGHEQRFLEKLNPAQGTIAMPVKKRQLWKPLSIAASIALVCVLGLGYFNSTPTIKEQVVEIAPEVSDTEFYFVNLIEEQIQELNEAKSPETEKLVEDTMVQLQKLASDYQTLERELVNGGDSKIIMSAMIINFQTRIDLLREVMDNIENIKNLKTYNDENITI